MNKKEAIHVMLGGEVLVDKFEYLCKYDNGFFQRKAPNDPYRSAEINFMSSDGYEIYQAPKPKVKMWQWLVKRSDDPRPFVTSYLHQDEQDLICHYGNIVPIQRLEHTMIEVESSDG